MPITERLKAEGAETLTIERAGLPLDPYFSASKLRWILDQLPEAKRAAGAQGRLRLGTSDSFFLDRLAGVYATDVTTASRTSLMNLATGQWDPSSAGSSACPSRCLPEIRPTAGDFGSVGQAAAHAPVSSTSRPPSSAMAAASRARRRSPSAPAPSRSAWRPATWPRRRPPA